MAFTVLKNGNILSFSIFDKINEWNTNTGQSVKSRDYGIHIISFCVLSNGDIVAGRVDGTIEIFNSQTLASIQTLYGHSEDVKKVLPLSGDFFASGSKDDKIILWNNTNGSWLLSRTFTGHTGDILDLVLQPTDILISLSADSKIKVWNYKLGQLVRILNAQNQLSSLVMLNGNYLAVGSLDKDITMFTVDFTLNQTFTSSMPVDVLAVTNKWLISGSNTDSSLTFWDVNSFEKFETILLNSVKITSIAVLSNSSIAVGSFGQGLIILSI